MTTFINLASFAGTAGQGIATGDANWTVNYQAGSTSAVVSSAARAYQNTGTEIYYSRTETPPGQTQHVEAVIRRLSAVTGCNVGVFARAYGSRSCIVAQLRTEAGGTEVRLYKIKGGTATQIGTTQAVSTADGNDYALRLEVSGTSPIAVVVKFGGATILNETFTDADFNVTGVVGLRFGFGSGLATGSTGLHVASFVAEDSAANTSPSFTGPNIADISGTQGVALTPVDVSAKFFDSESGLTFSAIGSWPAGVTVSSAGVISGTPTTAGTYASLQVRATDAGSLTADSNAFTITVAAPGDTENPTLTGSVTFASITQTSYTAQWPAGSDNVAVTGYEYQIGSTAGAWTDAGNNLSAAITGRTAGTTETVFVRAYDAAGLRSTPAISGSVTLLAATASVTSDEFKNNAGTLLASATIPKVWLIPFGTPDYTNLVTNGAGELVISEAGLSGDYLIVTANADGTEVGVSKATVS